MAARTEPGTNPGIPAQATPELADRLRDMANVSVLQHGFAHTNHAPNGEKKAEFGHHRPIATMRSELSEGRKRLKNLFGKRFVPIFVPPWNRVSETLSAEIMDLGFIGLSTFGPRTATHAMNCHADIIDWRGKRDFVGTETALGQILHHLAMRRSSATDATEHTGLMTHHLDHDPGCWQFIEDFAHAINNHPAAAWISSAQKAAGGQQ
jgi:peptidoglycan/xylan/chitin deacetylase (PgdA/CDA1 family)